MSIEEKWEKVELAADSGREELEARGLPPESAALLSVVVLTAARELALAGYRLGAYRERWKGGDLVCDRCDAILGVTEHTAECHTPVDEARIDALGK